jgi:hypothetical protein
MKGDKSTDKTIGFALGLGKQDRTATGSDFSGDIDTTQYTLSSYGALELSNKGSIEAVLGVVGVSLAAGKYVIRFHLNTVDVVANERR